MKTLILSAAATLALSGAALAQVTDAQAHFAQDFTGNEALIYDGVPGDVSPSSLRVSTKGGIVNDVAAGIFAQIADENRNRD